MENLSSSFPFFLALAMAATLIVLVIGILTFAVGGKFNARHSNTLMRWRVILQGVAVAIFALIVWTSVP